jgi:hypothetical protein
MTSPRELSADLTQGAVLEYGPRGPRNRDNMQVRTAT